MTEIRVLKAGAIERTEAGFSGADRVGATPQEGLTLSNGQPADSVMKQLRALRESGASVDTATETAAGIVEHATEAEVQAGTAGNLVATVARLKAELDRRQAPGVWVTPTLQNGWVAYDNTNFYPPQYRKLPDGNLQIRGICKSGTLGSVIFTLPAGFRPAKTEGFTANNDKGAGQINVIATGAVQQVGAATFQGNTFQYLSGIVFEAVQ